MSKLASFLQELTSLRVFIIVWFGQFASLLGSGLTGFALDLWVYQKTNSVTLFALVSLFTTLPPILISPIAGAFVDRWDRRWTMIISDFGAGLMTLSIAIAFWLGNLQVFHICIATGIMSTFSVFQRLASTTATSSLVPPQHLGRAIGMMQVSESTGSIFIPAVAGILILSVQLQGVLFIDFLTYIISLVTLLSVRFPHQTNNKSINKGDQPEKSEDSPKESIKNELLYGWRYIMAQPGLMSLVIYFTAVNFLIGLVSLLMVPMLLTIGTTATTGTILSLGGVGSLIGSVMMGIWGGPKQKIQGVFFFGILLGICIIMAGSRPSPAIISIAIFGGLLCFPIIAGCSEVLLLKRVDHDVQGRVFGLLGTISASCVPIAYLLAGPLVDYVFEPLMTSTGLLAPSIGQIIGIGAGRGIGLLFIVLGSLQTIITIISYFHRPLHLMDRPHHSDSSELDAT